MAMLNFFGDNWTTGTGNIDSFGFPTGKYNENICILSQKKSLIVGAIIMIFTRREDI